MKKDDEKDPIQKIVDDIKKDTPQKERNPIYFVVGSLLLIIGLFILSRKVIVTSGFFGFSLWGFNMGFGLIILPLIFGIIWMFYDPKSIFAKLLSVFGLTFIIVSVIMNTGIHLETMTLYDYIIIIGMIGAGIGLLFRYYFKEH